MSEEEARLKALELQREIRMKVKEKERKDELEREKRRMRQGKEISEARRVIAEREERLRLERIKKEKQEVQREKDRMRAILEADKRARFGDKLDEPTKKKVNIKEEFFKILSQMNKIYRYSDRNTLLSCMKMIKKYISNILKNPNEVKYQRVKTTNKVYAKRIKSTIGGVNLLKLSGFDDQGEYLVYNGNLQGMQEFNGYLQNEISKLDLYNGMQA